MPHLDLVSSLALGFAVSLLLYVALSAAVRRGKAGQQRLGDLTHQYPGLARNTALNSPATKILVGFFLELIEQRRARAPKAFEKQFAETERELSGAGVQSKWEPRVVLAYRLSLAAVVVIAGAVLAVAAWLQFNAFLGCTVLVLSVLLAQATFNSMLVGQVSERLSLVDRELPYALEFLSMMMRANATLEAALEEYCASAPPDNAIAAELRIVMRDLELGVGAKQAFLRFKERLRSDAVNAFVMALEHGIEQGQSLKNVFAEQARAVKLERYQSAERIAKQAAAKTVMPLMLTAFACMLLLLGPILIRAASTGID